MDEGRAESRALEVLSRRLDVLRRLREAPAHKRDLLDDLDQSRSTVDRAVDELETVDLAERGDEGVALTASGRLALEWFERFQAGFDDVVAAREVLAPLSADATVSTDLVAGSEALLSAEPAPYRPLERLHAAVRGAGHYRAALPALDDPRHVRLLYEHVVTEGEPAELVVPPSLLRTLREEFPRRMDVLADADRFRLFVGEVPPYALSLPAPAADAPPTVHVVVFDEHGGVHGTLANDDPAAVRWAEERYGAVRADADERTDALTADPDGGAVDADGGLARASIGRSLPVSLEREGFVRLGVPYFRDEPVAEPTTAWRAGLSIPEVHTGYAVARRPGNTEDDGSAGEGDGRRSVAGSLRERLETGENCVVLGPPGSGKSTTCKQVACEWYDAGNGPVLYRESGRGRPLSSVEDLTVTADLADGHALVVVEDAVRPDAAAVLDAVDRLGDREDVSFLLDARTHEWRDPPGDASTPEGPAVETMPAFDDGDTARLVEHFERTVGTSVDLPVERLREDVREEAADPDEAAPDEVLLLLHRLATYADPLATGRTSLEAAVGALYDDLAGDDLALDVATLANALNAAGIRVDAGTLYAVADSGQFGAVDAALDRLEGRVLFPRDDGSHRTVHESWSVAFLAHLTEAEGEAAAAERFGRCVSAALSLADGDRLAALESHLDRAVLPDLAGAPGEWADETVETLYALGRERPKLAPLFGDGEHDTVALPAACSSSVRTRRPSWLGRAFLSGGYYDRADRAFRRLPETDDDLGVERSLGLARVARERGEYGDAMAHARACLELGREADRPSTLARAKLALGETLVDRSSYEDARRHLREALDRFESLADRSGVASALDGLGEVAWRLAEYDAAGEHHRRSLEMSRELADLGGVTESLHHLGAIAKEQNDYDAAQEHYERSLERDRRMGDRDGAASTLDNLGLVARQKGEFDAARDYLRRAIEARRDLGDRHGEARSLGNLGLVAMDQRELAEAREHMEASLELLRAVGDDHDVAKTMGNLGEVAHAQGDLDAARDYMTRSLAVFREMGDEQGEAINYGVLGLVARDRGEFDRAREHLERSIETFDSIGSPRGAAESRHNLGTVLAEQGDAAGAREQFEAAVETYESIDVFPGALNSLERLVEQCREAGDRDAALEWCRHAEQLLGRAPEAAAETHREWIRTQLAGLDGG